MPDDELLDLADRKKLTSTAQSTDPVKFSGKAISAPGSESHQGNNREKVFDGDLQAKFAIRYNFESKGDEESVLFFEFELKKIDFFMMPFQKLIQLAIQDKIDRTLRNIKRLVDSESK
jgi:hypothetical protein